MQGADDHSRDLNDRAIGCGARIPGRAGASSLGPRQRQSGCDIGIRLGAAVHRRFGCGVARRGAGSTCTVLLVSASPPVVFVIVTTVPRCGLRVREIAELVRRRGALQPAAVGAAWLCGPARVVTCTSTWRVYGVRKGDLLEVWQRAELADQNLVVVREPNGTIGYREACTTDRNAMTLIGVRKAASHESRTEEPTATTVRIERLVTRVVKASALRKLDSTHGE